MTQAKKLLEQVGSMLVATIQRFIEVLDYMYVVSREDADLDFNASFVLCRFREAKTNRVWGR